MKRKRTHKLLKLFKISVITFVFFFIFFLGLIRASSPMRDSKIYIDTDLGLRLVYTEKWVLNKEKTELDGSGQIYLSNNTSTWYLRYSSDYGAKIQKLSQLEKSDCIDVTINFSSAISTEDLNKLCSINEEEVTLFDEKYSKLSLIKKETGKVLIIQVMPEVNSYDFIFEIVYEGELNDEDLFVMDKITNEFLENL